ncbi:agenet domain-containing protein [Tanacetum coccineum]
MIREYKTIKEKEDPGVFVLPIRLEGKVDTHRLADTSSNINIIPYRIFEELWREHVKPVSHNVSILNHYEVEPIGMLKDVLCQVGVTTVLASFLILDMPVGRTVPIIVGRSFLHTCRGIINTLKGTTSTFDGVCHQKFYVAEIQNNGEESDSDDEEEYYLKRDEMGRPFYGPNLINYFDRNDHMERALAIQDSINPFRKKFVWKKAVAFLGSLPIPLLHTDLIPKGSGDFIKEVRDGKWHTKIRVTDPYGNTFEQGYETSAPLPIPKLKFKIQGQQEDPFVLTPTYKYIGIDKLTKAQQVNYNVYVSAKEAEENENVELVKKTTLNEETMVDEVDEVEFAYSIIVNQEGPDTRLAPESHKESPEADTLFHTPRSSRIDLSSEKAPITELTESSTPSHS